MTREKILNAAIIEFSTYGFENVTTKDIAKKANVSEGSIFRYFKSKSDLLESAILPSVKEMIPQELNNVSRNLLKNQISLNFKNFLIKFYKNRYQFVLTHYPALKIYFAQLLFDYEGQKRFKRTVFKFESVYFLKLIKEMQRQGEISQDVKPNAIIYEIIVQFVGSIIKLRFMYGNSQKIYKNIDSELNRIVSNIIKIYGGKNIMSDIGIVSYGVSIPYLRLPVKSTIDVWKNNNADFINKQFGVLARTVVNSDEDTLTLATDAAKKALDNGPLSIKDIDSILLGSCSTPDIFKSNANQIMSFLSNKNSYFGCDIRASENSGLASLSVGASLINSKTSNASLIIGADTMCKNIFPSELRESYIGAGAAALILGTNDILAKIIGISSYNASFPEQCRTEDSRFIRTLANLNTSIIKEGLVKQCVNSIRSALSNCNLSLNDIDHFIFPESIGIIPHILAKTLNIKQPKIRKQFTTTGYLGSASPLVSFFLSLEEAEIGDKILVCGYGHGSGSTTVIFTVTKKPKFKKV